MSVNSDTMGFFTQMTTEAAKGVAGTGVRYLKDNPAAQKMLFEVFKSKIGDSDAAELTMELLQNEEMIGVVSQLIDSIENVKALSHIFERIVKDKEIAPKVEEFLDATTKSNFEGTIGGAVKALGKMAKDPVYAGIGIAIAGASVGLAWHTFNKIKQLQHQVEGLNVALQNEQDRNDRLFAGIETHMATHHPEHAEPLPQPAAPLPFHGVEVHQHVAMGVVPHFAPAADQD